MIARLSALDSTVAPRGPQEGIMGKHCGSLSTRKPTEPRLCRQLQDQHRLVETAVQCQGEGTVSAPDGRASTRNHWSAKRALRRFWWTSDLVQTNGLASTL